MNTYDWGTVAIGATAVLSLIGFFAGIIGHFRRDTRLTEFTIRTTIATFVIISFAAILLIHAFMTDQFNVMYVAYNSAKEMPIFYKFSAFWGSLDGSVLLWEWVLTGFAAVAMFAHRKTDRELIPLVGSILLAIIAFFAIMLLVTTNPFKLLDFTPENGTGLNPLLQNPGMIFHPPSLYTGFVGFTIPFAFAIAALISGRLDSRWLVTTRNWTLVAWVCLTLGNLLGGNWAYVELGWGGYWGWDPVENAAIMPWFTGTAFLHSVMIQEKRNMLRVWNVGLILSTFWLTIFGTFLTRSGVVSSIHAFSESNIGNVFVVFMAIGITLSVALVVWRWDQLATSNKIEAVLSRESAFLYNNIVLLGITFGIFWGTAYPIVIEGLTGDKLSVGAPLFNQLLAPFGLALLFLTGFGPIVSWRKMTMNNFRRNMVAPLVATVVAMAVAGAMGIWKPYALFTAGFVAFSGVAIGMEFWRGIRARSGRLGENPIKALYSLLVRNPRRYVGYVIHIGALMVFIAISGNLYSVQKSVVMAPGDVVEFEGYTIRYDEYRQIQRRNYVSDMSLFTVDGGLMAGEATMFPEKRQYSGRSAETSTEVAIHSSFLEDLYLILVERVTADGRAAFRFFVNPLVQWMWIGGGLMAIGGVISLMLTWAGRGNAKRKAA